MKSKFQGENMDKSIIKKIEDERDIAEQRNDVFSEKEEKEDFMDGEEIYAAGFAWGLTVGLNRALKILDDNK